MMPATTRAARASAWGKPAMKASTPAIAATTPRRSLKASIACARTTPPCCAMSRRARPRGHSMTSALAPSTASARRGCSGASGGPRERAEGLADELRGEEEHREHRDHHGSEVLAPAMTIGVGLVRGLRAEPRRDEEEADLERVGEAVERLREQDDEAVAPKASSFAPKRPADTRSAARTLRSRAGPALPRSRPRAAATRRDGGAQGKNPSEPRGGARPRPAPAAPRGPGGRRAGARRGA